METKTATRGAVLALAMLWAGLLILAARIQVDYFDVFNTLSNARTIALGGGPYEIRRFIFPAILQAPWFWVEAKLAADGLGFRAAHLTNVLLFALWLALIFRVYRRRLTSGWALGGVSALASVPLLLHYAPSAKEDLLSALLIWGAIGLARDRRLLAAGTVAGLAMGSRYNLIVVLPAFFVLQALLEGRPKREPAMVAALAGAVFAALPLVTYPLIRHATFADALPLFARELYVLFVHHATGYQPYYVFFQFTLLVVGLPYLLLTIVAIVDRLRRNTRDPELEFHAAWLLLNLAYHTFFQWGKEMRYLFPLLPSFFFLAIVGLQTIRAGRWRTAMTCLLIAYGATRAARELVKFRDPFYFTPFERTVSLRAKELAGGGRIFWIGKYYGLHPREAVFHPEDHFTYLYHFHSHVVRFYSGRPVFPRPGADFDFPEPGENRKWIAVSDVETFAHDGDVFIINTDTENNLTEDMTPTLPPLYVQRVRLRPKLEELADGRYDWYGRNGADEPWARLGRVDVAGHKIVSAVKARAPKESRFLTYDIVETHGLAPALPLKDKKDGSDYAQSREQVVPAKRLF